MKSVPYTYILIKIYNISLIDESNNSFSLNEHSGKNSNHPRSMGLYKINRQQRRKKKKKINYMRP